MTSPSDVFSALGGRARIKALHHSLYDGFAVVVDLGRVKEAVKQGQFVKAAHIVVPLHNKLRRAMLNLVFQVAYHETRSAERELGRAAADEVQFIKRAFEDLSDIMQRANDALQREEIDDG